MPLKASRTAANLKKKGFREERNHDHVRFILYVNGEETDIRTKISHGEDELGPALVSCMSKQLRLKKSDFVAFAECRLSESVYLQLLRQQRLID